MNQDINVVLLTAYVNIANICDRKWARKQHKAIFLLIHKDQIAKARSLGIKCVSLLDINFYGFSLENIL